MGALLLGAGEKDKRFCLPNSRVLIHSRWVDSRPGVRHRDPRKEILYLRKQLNEIMAKHTGQSVERISRDTDRDNFLSAEEAVKLRPRRQGADFTGRGCGSRSLKAETT